MLRPNTLGILMSTGLGIMSASIFYNAPSPKDYYIASGAGLAAIILAGITIRDPARDEQASQEAKAREQFLLSQRSQL